MGKNDLDPTVLERLKPIENSFIDMCARYSVSVDPQSEQTAEYLASTKAVQLLSAGYSVFDLYDFMKAELDDLSS